MDLIAAEGAELRTEQEHFATPDAQRNRPVRNWDEINAFQGCVAALDQWPLDAPMTGWDARLISQRCEHDAQTAYLLRLAKF